MSTITLDLPVMYGDHHVVEVRRILSALPGIADIYASSSFHIVEINYDAAQLTPDAIKTTLDEYGYLGELPLSKETDIAATENNGQTFFRHTAAFKQTGQVVNFGQNVPYSGRPLWPCPGIGTIKREEEPTHG